MKRLLLVALLAIGTSLFAQEAEHPAEHEEAGGELVVPDSLKWANFGILVVGLGYLLLQILPKNFAERTAAIQKDIQEAQAIRQDAERRAAEVEAKVRALGAHIEKFRIESAQEMAHEGERIQQETAALMKRVEAHAALEIEQAGKIAMRDLRRFAAELAVKTAEDRVRKRLDPAAEATLVDGFVAQLKEQGASSQERAN